MLNSASNITTSRLTTNNGSLMTRLLSTTSTSEEIRADSPPSAQPEPINVDPSPVLIKKKPNQLVQYTQNVSLKFLKPPPAPKPGDIVIKQEQDVQIQPAPPLFVRQTAKRPLTPESLIVRERPPKIPAIIPPKHIRLAGKVLPPPPRKVIVEKLPEMPPKPQDIVIERWLGYKRRTRNVIFHPAQPIEPLPAPKNVLIEWESPDVQIKKEFKFLGIEHTDPVAYVAKFGLNLAEPEQLPEEVNEFKTPDGEILAANSNSDQVPILTGDIQALSLFDLDKEGLGLYKSQL